MTLVLIVLGILLGTIALDALLPALGNAGHAAARPAAKLRHRLPRHLHRSGAVPAARSAWSPASSTCSSPPMTSRASSRATRSGPVWPARMLGIAFPGVRVRRGAGGSPALPKGIAGVGRHFISAGRARHQPDRHCQHLRCVWHCARFLGAHRVHPAGRIGIRAGVQHAAQLDAGDVATLTVAGDGRHGSRTRARGQSAQAGDSDGKQPFAVQTPARLYAGRR